MRFADTTILYTALLFAAGCGTRPSDQNQPDTTGSSGLIRLPDGGFHPIDFTCPDAGARTPPGDSQAQDGGHAACTAVNPNVRFSVDVAPILGSCSGELCHDAWKYATTVGVVSQECCDPRQLIDPGRPAQSYLLQKLKGTELCGNSSEMPPGAPVASTVLDVVESWICIGAPDN